MSKIIFCLAFPFFIIGIAAGFIFEGLYFGWDCGRMMINRALKDIVGNEAKP